MPNDKILNSLSTLTPKNSNSRMGRLVYRLLINRLTRDCGVNKRLIFTAPTF